VPQHGRKADRGIAVHVGTMNTEVNHHNQTRADSQRGEGVRGTQRNTDRHEQTKGSDHFDRVLVASAGYFVESCGFDDIDGLSEKLQRFGGHG
jgi:hypothetical protein